MYKDLTSEEKRKIREGYISTRKGKELTNNLNRLLIEGIICLVSCVVIVVLTLIYDLAWWYWFFAGLTLFCGILFLLGQYFIRMKEYNKFLIHDNKKGKNKLTKRK